MRYDDAIADCTKAIELDREFLKAYLRRAGARRPGVPFCVR